MQSRRFSVEELELGFVLVAGTVLAAINTMAAGPMPKDFGSKLAERVLLSLGVAGAEARTISRARIGLPKLPSGALIARSTRA